MNPTGLMRLSIFRSGLAPRLAVAALYGLLAFSAVARLAPVGAPGGSVPPAAGVAAIPTAAQPATLCLESLLPVASWEVRLEGVPVAARHADATTWIAPVMFAHDASLVIDAVPAAAEPARRNALRIRIAGTPVPRDQTFWCERSWSVTARVDRLLPSATPIDPADLP